MNQLREKCKLDADSMLLDLSDHSKWKLILPESACPSKERIIEQLKVNKLEDINEWLIDNEAIDLVMISEQPIQFMKDRAEILENVRSGKIPKGILKKWPLYILISS